MLRLSEFYPKPAGNVNDDREWQLPKHALVFVAFYPKPSGKVNDERFLQL